MSEEWGIWGWGAGGTGAKGARLSPSGEEKGGGMEEVEFLRGAVGAGGKARGGLCFAMEEMCGTVGPSP